MLTWTTKGHRGETYAKAMSVDLASPMSSKGRSKTPSRACGSLVGGGGGNPKNNAKKRRMMNQGGEEDLTLAPPVRDGLVLARASELPQPEKDQHFLRIRARATARSPTVKARKAASRR